MSANKRPSTSSLRRFITSRPYVTVAEIRRRFSLDEADAMAHLRRNGTSAWIGLPEREATKLEELWHRDELGLQLSVEVSAPVVVGVYPMRIARYVIEGNSTTERPASVTPAAHAGALSVFRAQAPSAGNGHVPSSSHQDRAPDSAGRVINPG